MTETRVRVESIHVEGRHRRDLGDIAGLARSIERDGLIHPANLLGRARGLRELIGGMIPQAVAEIVVETYNRSRRTRALPAWRSK